MVLAHKITVLGTGYVGLVCGVGLADFGNIVVCTDIDGGKSPCFRKGLFPSMSQVLKSTSGGAERKERLSFEADVAKAISGGGHHLHRCGNSLKWRW